MKNRWRKGEDGAAAVEFAIVVVILIWIIVAVIDFGAAYTEYEVVTGAAREGARYAAVGHTVDEVQTRIDAAITDPFNATAAAAVTVNGTGFSGGEAPCEDNPGEPVDVGWGQVFTITIFGANLSTGSIPINGTFRCE